MDSPSLSILQISGNFGPVTSGSWGNQLLPPNKGMSVKLVAKALVKHLSKLEMELWNGDFCSKIMLQSYQNHMSCGFTLPWLQFSPPFWGVNKPMWISGSAKEHFCDTKAPALLERSWDKPRQLVCLVVISYMSMLHVTCPYIYILYVCVYIYICTYTCHFTF